MLVKENNLRKGLLLTIILITIQSCASETKKTTPPLTLNTTTYPKHTCSKKPLKPKRPDKESSYKDIETHNLTISKYNLNVEKYNKEINSYKTCINKYIKALKEARAN